ncbi:hypothetical protein GPALN_013272 [Globodera pallida]|nr:hypothetical protein GPALN_013272 [Globodera pallida]
MKFAAFGLFLACLVCRLHGQPRGLVIITDMEPDDRIALAMVAASKLAQRVLAIGTTVLNAERKAELARHALEKTALAGVKVYAGTGGTADDYPKMKSTKAALEYGDQEGKKIIPQNVLATFIKRKARSSAKANANAFQKYLSALLERNDGVKIDFLVLAPPTDLAAVLGTNSELANAIGHVHLMGGWNETKGRTRSSDILRSSYNVNMDGRASAQLLKMASEGRVQVTLYSSHVIAKQFKGSINRESFPTLIEMIETSQAPCIEAFRTAGLHWDTNLVEHYEKLKDTVGQYKGKQFTPADPLTVLGLLNPKLIKATEKVKVEVIIPEGQPPSEEGYEMQKWADTSSGITLVTEFNLNVFQTEMERILQKYSNKGSTSRG